MFWELYTVKHEQGYASQIKEWKHPFADKYPQVPIFNYMTRCA